MISGKYKNLKDSELIAAYLKSKDQAFFNELHHRYSAKVFSKCLGILKNPILAEDATQDIFLKIYLKLDSFNHKAKFSTWVHAVTYNHCMDPFRKNKIKQVSVNEGTIAAIPANEPENVSDLADKKLRCLSVALNSIKADERRILTMKYWNGMKIGEMSEATNKSDSAIKMRLMRSKAKVRKIYQGLIDRQKQRVVAQR